MAGSDRMVDQDNAQGLLLDLSLRMADVLRPAGSSDLEWRMLRQMIAGRLLRIVRVMVERPEIMEHVYFVGSTVRAETASGPVAGVNETALWKHALMRFIEHGYVGQATRVLIPGRVPSTVREVMESTELKDIL